MTLNYVTDGTLNGLLSALFISFVSKETPIKVFGEGVYQPLLGVRNVRIRTSEEQSDRVAKALIKYGGDDVLRRLRVCMASCDEQALTVAFFFAYATLEARKNVINNLADKRVTDFIFIEQRVLVEKHHVKGFLRFEETTNGVLYARYSPDNDVTELVAPHFLRRLGGIPFVIHDLTRKKVAVSNGDAIKFFITDLDANFEKSNDEGVFNMLWKRYYKDVTIKERTNLKYQDRVLPRRYRKYMPETW